MTNLRSQNFLEAVWGLALGQKKIEECAVYMYVRILVVVYILLALLAFTILLATKRSANPHIPGWRRQRRWRRLTQRRRGGRFRGCGGSLQARAFPYYLHTHISKAALYSLALISQQKQYQKFETESIHFNLFKMRLIFCKLERIFLNKNCKQKGEKPTLKEANSAYIKRLTS